MSAQPARAVTMPNRSPVGIQLLASAELLLLGSWLGSVAFFSFAVAPSAFAVLPSRELAGAIVTSTIARVELIGLVIGPVLILCQLVFPRLAGIRSVKGRGFRVLLTLLMFGAAALSHFWVSPTMATLREAMGGAIDDIAATDPMRVQFNDLHQYSVALMSVALFSGILLFFLTVRTWLKR